MKNIFYAAVFFLTACGTEEELTLTAPQALQVSEPENSHVWICHHPGTKQHNQECIEEQYPRGCYVPGDNTKFCWLLDDTACTETNDAEWLSFCE